MKAKGFILLLVTMTILISAGLGGLMTGCDANGNDSAPKTQQKELRDDPDAFSGEEPTFEMDKTDQ